MKTKIYFLIILGLLVLLVSSFFIIYHSNPITHIEVSTPYQLQPGQIYSPKDGVQTLGEYFEKINEDINK